MAGQVLVERSAWRRSLAILAACVVAMTVTPLGLHFWIEIPRSLMRISRYTLDEWKPPGLAIVMVPFWIVAGSLIVNMVRYRHRVQMASPAQACLYATALILLPAAVSSVRHVGPFLMLAVPALTHLLPVAKEARRTAEERPALNVAIVAIATALVFGSLIWAYWSELPRLRWHPLPAGALAALDGCPGNLYNRYDEGGALLWFAPERRVFLDGRQDPFSPALVLEHIEMETGKRDYRDTFARHDMRCAILPVKSPVASRLGEDGWTPRYRDNRWVVFAR